MRLGEKVKESTMSILYAPSKITLRHPRCGVVEISLINGAWVCTACERHDPKVKKP